MSELLQADGDSWRWTSEPHDGHSGARAIVFHCISDSGRPYRVVEVAEELIRERDIASLRAPELQDLFARSHTMDYSHDVAAEPESHGYGDPPLH